MTETHALQPKEKQELQTGGEGTRPGRVFRPDVDILENADGFIVYADLPGVDENTIDVRLEKGTLTLDAHLAVFPDEGWSPLHTEYRLGSYHREFRLSEGIDSDAVSAKMNHGVLELTLPKSAQRRPRSIPVQGA